MVANAGAFPRDPMDTRLMASVRSGVIDETNRAVNPADDALRLPFSTPPTPPADRDDDGMPDAWELAHGTDPDELALR
jgi:hypothetical protein